jgi:hypothetical protein
LLLGTIMNMHLSSDTLWWNPAHSKWLSQMISHASRGAQRKPAAFSHGR